MKENLYKCSNINNLISAEQITVGPDTLLIYKKRVPFISRFLFVCDGDFSKFCYPSAVAGAERVGDGLDRRGSGTAIYALNQYVPLPVKGIRFSSSLL